METRFICRLHNGATVLNPYTPVRFDDDIDVDYYSPSTSSLTLCFEPMPVEDDEDIPFVFLDEHNREHVYIPPAQCFDEHYWAWRVRQFDPDWPF